MHLKIKIMEIFNENDDENDNLGMAGRDMHVLTEWSKMNKHAQALGRRAKGIPKNFSVAERARRKELLALARAKRWPAKAKNG